MSVQLLDKTRKINKLLHNNHSHKVVFNDICEVLSEILESNIPVSYTHLDVYKRQSGRNQDSADDRYAAV